MREFSQKYREVPPFVGVHDLTQGQMRRAEELNLGLGEREALILAQDLDALLVIEDRKARNVGRQMGLKVVGTYGIIRQAYIDCIISRDEMVKMMEELKSDLFYEDWLVNWVLKAEKQNIVV